MTENNLTELERFSFQGFMEGKKKKKNLPIWLLEETNSTTSKIPNPYCHCHIPKLSSETFFCGQRIFKKVGLQLQTGF